MKIPQQPPNLQNIAEFLKQKNFDIAKLLALDLSETPYLSYSDTKYRAIPAQIAELGGKRELWWAVIALKRSTKFQNLPLCDVAGKPFKFFLDNCDLQLLHELDLNAKDLSCIQLPFADKKELSKYILESIIEESFSSSAIEGALSTRDLAKKMIAEQRTPKDKSEQMILNNFTAMQSLIGCINEPLSSALICKIHAQICEKTLPYAQLGVFRTQSSQNIVVGDDAGNIYHTPCPPENVANMIEDLCAFANSKAESESFIHPIIKASIIHFFFAYIHPFYDGNGRTARALFYWYLLKNGYEIAKFISISKIISQTGNRYYQAFLDSETDYNDLNYFIKFQLEILNRAIKAFADYAKQKADSFNKALFEFRIPDNLNYRQSEILLKLLQKNPFDFECTILSHATLNNISWETSRKDLTTLLKQNILKRVKSGKKFVFKASNEIIERTKHP